MNKNNKTLIVSSVLGLLIVGAGIFLYQLSHHMDLPTGQPNRPTTTQQKQQSQANAERKKQAIENTSSPTTTNAQSTTTGQPSNDQITLSARQEQNSSVTVFTKITGIGTGTCKLTVTNNSKTTTQSADIIYQPEYSSCAGFSVPIGSVGVGMWNINLAVTANGNTIEKSITQEVK